MRVLITNLVTWPLSGTVTYVRDLACGLQRRGWTPAVFSDGAGPLCDELRSAGIAVVSRLDALPWAPDVIHGHHLLPLSAAVARWPGVPVVHICHDHTSIHERPLLHPAVRRYLAVSEVCRTRQIRDGVPPERTDLLFNFVDVARYAPRRALPARPARALVFSNYATESTVLPVVREACRRAGLPLDVVGNGVGRLVTHPEALLGEYDIVFAKAKAALEAMAVGTAVVLCDFAGVGPMVTTAGLDDLRRHNFGYATLTEPLTVATVLERIGRYDPAEAAAVCARIRDEASLERTLDHLERLYRDCMAEGPIEPVRSSLAGRARLVRDRLALRLYWRWLALSPQRRARLRALGVSRMLQAAMEVVVKPRPHGPTTRV